MVEDAIVLLRITLRGDISNGDADTLTRVAIKLLEEYEKN